MAFPSTYLDLQTAVANKLRLNLTDDLAKIKDWINQTYADVAQETRCFQQTATATLTSGISTYTIDATILHIELLTVTQAGGTAWFPLKQASLDEILNWRARNIAASGPSLRYTLVGLNQLELWPTPSAADTLTTYYSYLPAVLSANGDVPALPEPHASNLLTYGPCVKGAEFKRDVLMLGDFQTQSAQAMADFQRYLNRKAGAYPKAFTTWTGSGGYPPHDPSTDVPGDRGS